MRIVQVVEYLGVGGLEKMAIDLAIAQKAAGADPSIYCVGEPGALAHSAEAAGVPVVSFHKKPGFSAKAIFRMARQLRADRAEAVHTHNWIVHHYGAAAAALAGVKAVVNTQHGLETVTARQTRLFRSVLPLTKAVVFVAEQPRRIFREATGIPAAKTRVISNGIRVDRFLSRPAHPGAQRPRIRFGTVGRLVPVKDHATLLRAFAEVAPRLPDADLRIVGYGALQSELGSLARNLGVHDRFQILAPDTDVPAFLSELDLFVLSSLSEGQPVCILEAMAAGLPIVSTRVGGVPEVAEEDCIAWYCPSGNAELLANAMYNAAMSADLTARSARARDAAQTRFNIRSTWAEYEKLFLDLLGKQSANGE